VNKYVRIAVSAVLLGWIAWHTDWPQVRDAFVKLKLGLWFAAVGVLLLCQAASARRWQVLARELRFERSVPRLLAYYLIGMYFNLLLPTSVGGDVMRAWYLDGGSGRKLGALAAVLLDRINGLLVLIAMACVAVALSPLALPAWVSWTVWGIAGSAALGLGLLPVLQRLDVVPEARRQQLRTMLHALRAPRALLEATAWSVFVQIANVLLVWLIGRALRADVPLSYYFVFVPMVSLLTLLPISVNGMGVREGGVALFLTPLGVSSSIATALAFLWFLTFGAVGLLGGVVYLWGAFPKPASTADAPEVNHCHGSLDCHPDQGRAGQLDEAA
jgi:glycosyltransferase 2 family protein